MENRNRDNGVPRDSRAAVSVQGVPSSHRRMGRVSNPDRTARREEALARYRAGLGLSMDEFKAKHGDR